MRSGPGMEGAPADRPDNPPGLHKGLPGTRPTAARSAEDTSGGRHTGGGRGGGQWLPGELPPGSGQHARQDSASREDEVHPKSRDAGEGATPAEKEGLRGGAGHLDEEEPVRVLRVDANLADTILLHSQGSQEPEKVVDSLESVSSQQGPQS